MDNEVRFYRIEDRPDVNYIVDIGAHTGHFADYAHRLYPTALIDCFEPDPTNYAELIKHHPDSRQRAVYSVSNQKLPFIDLGTDESKVDWFGTGRILVDTISLDQLLLPFDRVDILKCDCEGSEFDIFMAASGPTMQKIQFITMEFHDWRGPDHRQALIDKLKLTHNMTAWHRPPWNDLWYGELRTTDG